MATITGVYKYTTTDKALMSVSNGSKSDQSDVNDVWETTDTKLGVLETDMALVNSQATLAENWATDAQGDDSNLGTGNYSSLAYAEESEGWANAADGAGIPLADGTSSSEESSKTHATNAASSATAAATSANFEGSWLAGTYTLPSSVYHDGNYWNLLVASTTGEPGVSSDWAVVSQGVNSNLLINPDFIVNQEEYVDDADLALDAYCYDMWKSGNAISVNGVSVSGATVIAESSNTVLQQINNDLISHNGETVTASIAAGEVKVVSGASNQIITPGNPFTFTLTASASDAIEIRNFNVSGFSGLKVEVGSLVTKYERPQLATEKSKCLDYYERISAVGSGDFLSVGYCIDSTDALGVMTYHFKHSTPTITKTATFLFIAGAIKTGTTAFDQIRSERARWSFTTTALIGGQGVALGLQGAADYMEINSRY